MSVTYTGTDGLFTHLGKLVKHYNQFKTDAADPSTGMDADRDEILGAFQAGDQEVAVDGLIGAFARWKAEYVERRAELANFALARLQDKKSVLNEIGASSTSPSEILAKLIEAMNEDGQSVAASAVSIVSVTADPGNQGGGTILTTDLLDGASSPGSLNGVAMEAQLEYNGLTTELAAPGETHHLRVVADSFHDDLGEGAEQISWHGAWADEPHGLGEDGAGNVGVIQPIHAVTDQHITNADFEDAFNSGVPESWDLVSGVGDTNVKQAGSADADHGSNALLFEGDGVASSIEIKQDIPAANVVSRKRYCVTARLKQAGASGGTLTIQFEGTGYTAGASEKISVAASSIGSNYGLHHFFVTMPARIPNDFRLVIRWAGATPGSGEQVFIDDLGMGPVNYGAGFGVVAVRESGPFVRGDSYEIGVTNTEGVFQSFFRRVFGVQLPSSAASPTIPDTLSQ